MCNNSMYSVTESIPDAHCVQRLLLIFNRSMATPDVHIKFFPERTYQLIIVGGGGGAGGRGGYEIFEQNISVLQNHSPLA